jgi:phosphoglucosamine mutase
MSADGQRRWFGTDGVRGRVGQGAITPENVLRLGYAVAAELAENAGRQGRPKVLIGKDTRISGYMLESALEAGFCAAGIDVLLLGPMPTPAVAYLTRALRLQAGVMISASHNPYDDNGIKFFNGSGAKLPDQWELAIEARMAQPMQTRVSRELGRVRRLNDAAGRYIEFCKSTFPTDLDLKGLKIAIDCANGACYHVAPPVLHELGAEIHAVAVTPDGFNINADCGATHPAHIAAVTRAVGADFGIAIDGDGDRLVMCDGEGRIFDGDELLFAIARDRHERGLLGGGVVGTLMSNYALEKALAAAGIPFERARVGDRYVLETLVARDWLLGGENSGHVICRDRQTTGDAIVAALQVLAVLRARSVSLAEWLSGLVLLPQVLINVRTAPGQHAERHPKVVAAAERIAAVLHGRGRVLLRASGTEPLVRVMVEGEERAEVTALAEELAAIVRAVGVD